MNASLLALVLSMFIFPTIIQAESETPTSEAIPVISQELKMIHLNQADVNTLTQSFKGIGRKRAEAIVAYREAHGPFKSVEDLAQVKGIGKQFVERNLQKLEEVFSVE